jgi:hypothetical protein
MTMPQIDPLSPAPEKLHEDIYRAWLCFRHLAGLDSPLSLAANCGTWVNLHGVPLAAVAQALRAVTHPRRVREVKYASDLLTVLADLITPRGGEADMRALALECGYTITDTPKELTS